MVGFAVLGCGRIGRVHAANISAHPDAELVACYDVADPATASLAGAHGARHARSVDEVLGDNAVQAVLCEKPIDLDSARVDACWHEIGPLNPIVMVGFNRRFDPSFSALRDRVAGGEIGRLEQVVITSRDPSPPPASYVAVSGGLFRDMTIHDFDMARFLAGDIVEVQAMGANSIDPAIGEQGDIDSAMVVMRAASGALVHINNSRRCAYGYDQRIEAFGAGGMLQAHNRHLTTVEAWGAERTHAADRVQDFFIARYAEAYRAELDQFITCVRTGAAPTADFAAGRAALRLADAALESLRTGAAVKLA
jgi:myo-inositol 2-dehydrogenase/D-chiro-inositol 1-dehydrogenase